MAAKSSRGIPAALLCGLAQPIRGIAIIRKNGPGATGTQIEQVDGVCGQSDYCGGKKSHRGIFGTKAKRDDERDRQPAHRFDKTCRDFSLTEGGAEMAPKPACFPTAAKVVQQPQSAKAKKRDQPWRNGKADGGNQIRAGAKQSGGINYDGNSDRLRDFFAAKVGFDVSKSAQNLFRQRRQEQQQKQREQGQPQAAPVD